MTDPSTSEPLVSQRKELSGRVVVCGMFAFACVATGLLWFYWYYHNAPFVPLQRALAKEFAGCQPRVDGGHRKMHLGTPKLLWVILRMPFKPDVESTRSKQVAERALALARETLPVDEYEQLKVRLFFGEPERVLHKADFEFRLRVETSPPE